MFRPVSLMTALLAAALCGVPSGGFGQSEPTANGAKAQFPEELQPLLVGVSDALAEALLKLRNGPAGTVVWRDGGGALAEAERNAYWNDWEQLTGWRIQETAPPVKPGEVQAQVESGAPQFDIFETGSGGAAYIMERGDLLEPLDKNLFEPIFSALPEGYLHSDYWIGYTKIANVIMWNTDVWPVDGEHPQTAQDFFDVERFPGKRCISKNMNLGSLEYPLLGAGVPKDEVFPLNFDMVLAELGKIRSDIVWYTSLSQATQFVLSGECAMTLTAHGRPAALALEGEEYPVAVSWDSAVLSESRFAITKGAPNEAAAQTALAYAFRPEAMCRLLNSLGYGVPFDPSCLNEFANEWAVTADRITQGSIVDDSWYAENYEKLFDKYNAWQATPQ